MIHIPSLSGRDGRDRAAVIWNHCVFRTTSAHGVTMALARELIAAGCPDQPWRAIGRDRPGGEWRQCLHGPSLHHLARWTITEGDAPIRLRLYQPRPGGG